MAFRSFRAVMPTTRHILHYRHTRPRDEVAPTHASELTLNPTQISFTGVEKEKLAAAFAWIQAFVCC